MSDEEGGATPIWEGSYDEAGLPHGEGTMTYPSTEAIAETDTSHEAVAGEVYEGWMEHGKKHGTGRYRWQNGCVYDGEYYENAKSGHGVMTMSDGSKYEGSFAGGVFEGQGVYTYANGDFYTGNWARGQRHGDGVYHCKIALCQYEGGWSEGEFATGRVLFRDGTTYTGQFTTSVADGFGEFCFGGTGRRQKGSYNQGRWTNASLETATQ